MSYPSPQDPRSLPPANQPVSGGYYYPAVPAPFSPPAGYPPVPVPYGPADPYATVGPYGPVTARQPRSAGAAVALELVLGLFGIFGVGNIYAGRTGTGVALMISFWVLFWVNVVLCFVFIGVVTMPLTWIGFMIAGALMAARAVENHNAGY